MTRNDAINRLCVWAQSQIGTHEGENNWNKYSAMPEIIQLYGRQLQNEPWCFTENTLILTQDGYKRIQNIEVGDFVLSAHGSRFNKVVNIFAHNAPVREYKAYGALPFSVTADHPFLSEKRNNKYHRKNGFKDWGFHPIEELNKDDVIAMPKTPVLYEDALSYDDLWTVGYYVGDGCFSKGNEYVLCANEQKAEKINLHAVGRWDKNYASRTCKQFNFSVFGRPVLKETLDDCGRGAANKRVPRRVLFGTLDAKRAFLDGYFAADGCEANHSFNSVSAELVTGVARLLADLDNPCSINVQKRPPQSRIWDARINAYRTINQCEKIYNCSVCNTDDTLHQHFIVKEKYVMLPLRKIGDERIDTVYTITTDGDHTYTANNLGVHNCDIFTDAAFISSFGLEKGAAMTYQRIGGGSALCRDSARYFAENGAWRKSPEPGDVVFFFYDSAINHMGIVTGVSGGSVFTVEGNTADMVAERCYSVHDPIIAGFGRPKWEIVADGGDTQPAKQQKGESANMQGVDISHYQAGLTIQQLRDAGMDFAILKVTEGTYLKDGSAFEFYRQAHELGFPVGCYCYSHAVNAQQAMAEAAFLMDTIKGFPMPCGVFLDIEEQKTLDLDHGTLLNVIRGWCAGIGGRGYIPGIYSSEGTLWSKISPDELPDGCLVWVAKWSNTQPSIRCDIWQNSDTGRVDGYSGPIDTDVGLSDYFRTLVSMTDYHRADTPQSAASSATETATADLAPDACPIFQPNPAVVVLQLLMSYDHKWGKPDGQKSPEFFAAIRRFIDDLEK